MQVLQRRLLERLQKAPLRLPKRRAGHPKVSPRVKLKLREASSRE